jgi:peptidoglycan/xylan/chitin deacetylase (PgdA/CDA1 family)
MGGPPPHISARRAQRPAGIRRRRGLALLFLALVAAIAVVIVVRTDGTSSSASANAGGATPGQGATSSGHSRAEHHGSGGSRPTATTSVARDGMTAVARLARYGLPVYCAGPKGNAVAFTFDDGPGPYTHYALKKLTEAHERATFFVVGRSIDNFPQWIPREMKLAAIGDHSYTHPVLTQMSEAEATSQLSRTVDRIKSDSGGLRVGLFRPPYGARNATIDNIAKSLGLLEIVWNVDSADSLGANYAGIIHNVEAGLHPGSIILMHENRGQTIRALTTILPELHRRHMRSVTVPELLSEDPPSLAQLKAGPAGCSIDHRSGSGG